MSKNDNIINLNINLDTPIYRVYDIKHLLNNYLNKQNVLVRPAMWDDPFENFLLKSKIKYQEHFILDPSLLNNDFYGQCWTFNSEESDALWRIYSPSKNGVRVKTTIRKLFDGFYDSTNSKADITYFIGKVRYEDVDAIIKELSIMPIHSRDLFDNQGSTLINFFLLKRPEFKHENELRLIYHERIGTEIYSYKIDPISLYDEILFDPRMPNTDADKYKAKFESYGFTKPIKKSTLYNIPDFTLNVID